MNMDSLDAFGKLVVERVRDHTIHDWEATFDGTAMTERTRIVRAALGKLEPEQRDIIVHQLMPQIVDTAIYYFLWMLEQEEDIDIPALRDASDGLAAELHDWIDQFTTKPHTRP